MKALLDDLRHAFFVACVLGGYLGATLGSLILILALAGGLIGAACWVWFALIRWAGRAVGVW